MWKEVILMENQSIGDKILALRKAKGWSQYDLEQKSGVSRPTIQLIESNRLKKVEYWNVKRIAEALEVDPDVLYGIEKDKSFNDVIAGELEILDLKLHEIIKQLKVK